MLSTLPPLNLISFPYSVFKATVSKYWLTTAVFGDIMSIINSSKDGDNNEPNKKPHESQLNRF